MRQRIRGLLALIVVSALLFGTVGTVRTGGIYLRTLAEEGSPADDIGHEEETIFLAPMETVPNLSAAVFVNPETGELEFVSAGEESFAQGDAGEESFVQGDTGEESFAQDDAGEMFADIMEDEPLAPVDGGISFVGEIAESEVCTFQFYDWSYTWDNTTEIMDRIVCASKSEAEAVTLDSNYLWLLNDRDPAGSGPYKPGHVIKKLSDVYTYDYRGYNVGGTYYVYRISPGALPCLLYRGSEMQEGSSYGSDDSKVKYDSGANKLYMERENAGAMERIYLEVVLVDSGKTMEEQFAPPAPEDFYENTWKRWGVGACGYLLTQDFFGGAMQEKIYKTDGSMSAADWEETLSLSAGVLEQYEYPITNFEPDAFDFMMYPILQQAATPIDYTITIQNATGEDCGKHPVYVEVAGGGSWTVTWEDGPLRTSISDKDTNEWHLYDEAPFLFNDEYVIIYDDTTYDLREIKVQDKGIVNLMDVWDVIQNTITFENMDTEKEFVLRAIEEYQMDYLNDLGQKVSTITCTGDEEHDNALLEKSTPYVIGYDVSFTHDSGHNIGDTYFVQSVYDAWQLMHHFWEEDGDAPEDIKIQERLDMHFWLYDVEENAGARIEDLEAYDGQVTLWGAYDGQPQGEIGISARPLGEQFEKKPLYDVEATVWEVGTDSGSPITVEAVKGTYGPQDAIDASDWVEWTGGFENVDDIPAIWTGTWYFPLIQIDYVPTRYEVNIYDLPYYESPQVVDSLLLSLDKHDSELCPLPSVEEINHMTWRLVYGGHAYENLTTTEDVWACIEDFAEEYDPEEKIYLYPDVELGTSSYLQESWMLGMARPEAVIKTTNDISKMEIMYSTEHVDENGNVPDQEYHYTEEAPTDPGRYVVRARFPASNGYSETVAYCSFAITYLDHRTLYVLPSSEGEYGWFNGDVTVRVVDGYQIRLVEDTGDDAWKDSVTLTKTEDKVQFREMKTGALSEELSLISIDRDAPEIAGVKDGGIYYGDTLTLTAKDENIIWVLVDDTTYTPGENGGEITFEIPGDERFVQITAMDKAGNQTVITIQVRPVWARDGIAAGKRYFNKGMAYMFGSGKWRVTGDSTVYVGGGTFYTEASGEFELSAE